MSTSCLIALVVLTSSAFATLTGIDFTSQASITPGNAGLATSSLSYTYTVTTLTTIWNAPTFATASPIPACSDSMCPTLDHKRCQDTDGDVYGVICDTRFSGVVITNNGKRLMERETVGETDEVNELEKRTYSGTLDACTTFCDMYDVEGAKCMGVAYGGGYCMAYDTITGTFNDSGRIAAVRQT